MLTVTSIDRYGELVGSSSAVLSYFSTGTCNVCRALKPKVIELLSVRFPEIVLLWIDIEKAPLVAGQNQVYSAPTLVVYFEGREAFRKSRNISMQELESGIARTYDLLFKK